MKAITAYKGWVSKEEVAAFNSRWPCSSLRSTRAYWFEFDASGDLIDTDLPEHDDGPAASAMADDVKDWLFSGREPEWMEGNQYENASR